MKVIQSSQSGFCNGVKRAITIAEANPNSVIVGGGLCNNNDEMSRLAQVYNITIEHDHSRINATQTAIIRAHGIPERIEQSLRSRGIKIIDATCPNVKAVQKKIQELDAQGYTIILLGDPDHPETQGHQGYAQHPIIVITDSSQTSTIKLTGKIAIISQTTKDETELLKVHQLIKASHPKNEVVFFNTVCNATKLNQQAAISLARKVDIIIIVGGKHSYNSNLLAEITKKFCQTHLIENASQLERHWFDNKKTCGLTSGVSTPTYILQAVKAEIEKF